VCSPALPPVIVWQGAEWGLGLQLVRSGGAAAEPPCWGHYATNGSFALVVPGRRPLVAALLLNRTSPPTGPPGGVAAQRVFEALAAYAAGRRAA
jgi:hypothetical protein